MPNTISLHYEYIILNVQVGADFHEGLSYHPRQSQISASESHKREMNKGAFHACRLRSVFAISFGPERLQHSSL